MIQELWKDIKGYEGLYKISNIGRVRSVERYHYYKTSNQYKEFEGKRLVKGRILKPYADKRDYQEVSLCKDGNNEKWKIHRLVGIHFINNLDNKPMVGHIDNDPSNNKIDNLVWCDQFENMQHASRCGRIVNQFGKCEAKI